MTKEEFLETTSKLQAFYHRELNNVQISYWYDELKKYDIEKYKRVVGEFVRYSKSFPSLSEVLPRIANLKEDAPKKEEELPRVKCNTCHGSGIVKYIKKNGGMEYDYYCKCYCQNGARVTYPLRKYEEVFYYRKPSNEVPAVDYDISQIKF